MNKNLDFISVIPTYSTRIFGCGKLPHGLFCNAIKEKLVFLTTTRDNTDPLSTTINIKGLFKGKIINEEYYLGKYSLDYASDFESYKNLAIKDEKNKINIISSNNQEYIDFNLKTEASQFTKNLLAYLAIRFKINSHSLLQIAPLELFNDNGEFLYKTILKAFDSEDIKIFLDNEKINIENLKQYLINNCCWYVTIDDKIVSTRQESEELVDNHRLLDITAEPYGSLHFTKTKISKENSIFYKLKSPFINNQDYVLEVDNLAPFVARKLALLNAVHVFIVIETLKKSGINKFSEIKNFDHAVDLIKENIFVRNEVDKNITSNTESIDKVEQASKALLNILIFLFPSSGIDFESFLLNTFERFNNPFIDHKIIDIFQGMDKFTAKIEVRIGYFLKLLDNNYKNNLKEDKNYLQLLEYYNFDK